MALAFVAGARLGLVVRHRDVDVQAIALLRLLAAPLSPLQD
jgi:hypothetical protein